MNSLQRSKILGVMEMAKFSRFDPRNKKKNRNKTRSLNRDYKIRKVNTDDEKPRLKKRVVLQAE